MFRDGRGALFELLRSLGRPMNDCGAGKTPLAVMLERGVLDERWIVVHLNELAEEDFARLETRTALSHRALPAEQPLFSAPAFRAASVARARLQHLLSGQTVSRAILRSAFSQKCKLCENAHPWLAPEQILEMATINGARALPGRTLSGKFAPASRPI